MYDFNILYLLALSFACLPFAQNMVAFAENPYLFRETSALCKFLLFFKC